MKKSHRKKRRSGKSGAKKKDRNVKGKKNGRYSKPAVTVTIPCDKCGGDMSMDFDLKRRAVDGHDGVVELGFLCPTCRHWHHIFFEDHDVRVARDAYNEAKQAAIAGALRDDRDALIAEAGALRDEFKETLRYWHYIFFEDHDVRVSRDAYNEAKQAAITGALRDEFQAVFDELNGRLRDELGIRAMSRMDGSEEE